MRTFFLLLIVLLLLSPIVAHSQSIIIGDDGIVRCKGVSIGTTQTIFGDTYEVVDRNLLIQRRNEGKDLTKVCVSNVTDMSQMFRERQFNQNISNWDVSSVTNMSEMFFISQFNQPIGNWDVSKVINMYEMFSNSPFNQPIGDWNVSNVRDMKRMFKDSPFNQPISKWDVSKVTNMEWMFINSQFNQPIGNWDVSSVTNMNRMFSGSPFNQPIGDWNVSNVRVMEGMFGGNPEIPQFNQPIGNWDVSNVRDMNGMFVNSKFNQPIGDWDVSNVTDMGFMFAGSQFNQPIGNWDVSSVTRMVNLFVGSTFNQPIGDWDVSSVTDMEWMFWNSQYNQPIGNWDVSNVTNMFRMFGNSQFNQPIGNWDVSSVTNMSIMFSNSQFNYPINFWCVTKITSEPSEFSTNSPLTPENKPVWGTCPGTPQKVIQISPQNNSTDVSRNVEFNWRSDKTSTKYQLQVFEGVSPTVIDLLVLDTTYIHNSVLKDNFVYNWRVRGYNETLDRYGEWSTVWKFTTQVEPVGTVTLLTPQNNSTNQTLTPTLSWNSEPNSQSYRVQVSTDNFSTIVVDQQVTQTSLTTPQLSHSTQYSWRVRGTNTSGNGEWSTVWKFTTQVGNITLVLPENNSTDVSRNVELSWIKDTQSTKYQLQVSEGTNPIVIDTLVSDTTYTHLYPFKDNFVYNWRVRGYNETLNRYGEWSSIWKFKTEIDPNAVQEINLSLNERWNIIGLPVQVDHSNYQELFPNSVISTLFEYTNTYQSKETLEPGKGYWIRMQQAGNATLRGAPIESVELNLQAGWNLISGSSSSIATSNIEDLDEIVVAGTIFGFNGSYVTATSIDPGKGYWVRTNQAGTITLRGGSSSKTNTSHPSMALVDFDQIEFLSSDGDEPISTLYLNGSIPTPYTSINFELPPVPPTGNVDVRWEDGSYVSESNFATALIQQGTTPVQIRIPAHDLTTGQSMNDSNMILIREFSGETLIKEIQLNRDLRFTLSEQTTKIEIEISDKPDLPTEFSLDQNYPNPFNPTTNIRFGLPKSADVRLEVYTVLGQRVMTLVNENRSAGWHTVSFNGAGLSSGVYVYRIQAGGLVQTKKLMLVK
jgi:surface protein